MIVMMANTSTVEEQIAHMTKLIEGLIKHVQNQNDEIAKLIDKIGQIDENSFLCQSNTKLIMMLRLIPR